MGAWQRLLNGDDRSIRKWFDYHPGCNWGVLPGYRIIILDCDLKNGVDGEETLEDLEFEHGRRIPGSLRVRTGSGGLHVYLGLPEGITITAHPRFWPNVDVLAIGSMAVMPGSLHHSGSPYEWIQEYSDAWSQLEEAPAWLLELLRPPSSTNPPSSHNNDTSTESTPNQPQPVSLSNTQGGVGGGGKAKSLASTDGLRIREPQLSGEQKSRLFLLAQRYERFSATWEHDRAPGSKFTFANKAGDHSASIYEMSLAAYLVADGWDDQSIVDACVTWRQVHHIPVPDYVSKYSATIKRARRSNQFRVSVRQPKGAYRQGDRKFAIFNLLVESGPLTPAEIALRLGMNRSTVRNTLTRMLTASRSTHGLVLAERQAGMYAVSAEMVQILTNEPVAQEPSQEEIDRYFASLEYEVAERED